MKRPALNLLIDLVAGVCFVGMSATGYLLRFPLPPGTNKSLSLWGLTRHEWGGVHFWISIGLLLLLLTHVALHWQWVATVVARQFRAPRAPGRHVASGLITLAAVAVAVGLFAWAAEVSVKEREDPPYPPAQQEPAPGSSRVAEADSADGPATVSFWADVYPVLEGSCLSCHGPRRAQGGFRVDRREDYFDRSTQPPLVVPGHSEASPLIAIVTGQRTDIAMPASVAGT